MSPKHAIYDLRLAADYIQNLFDRLEPDREGEAPPVGLCAEAPCNNTCKAVGCAGYRIKALRDLIAHFEKEAA